MGMGMYPPPMGQAIRPLNTVKGQSSQMPPAGASLSMRPGSMPAIGKPVGAMPVVGGTLPAPATQGMNPAPAPVPPHAQGAAGGPVQQRGQAPAPAGAGTPTTMQQLLAQFFGADNPFNVRSLYGATGAPGAAPGAPAPGVPGAPAAPGVPTAAVPASSLPGAPGGIGPGGDPIQATADFAQRELQKSLAGLGASSAASGLGWSGRRGLAEGEAIAGSNAQLGRDLGQLSVAQQAQDRDRALQASLGAYGVANNQNAQTIQMLQALNQAGGGLLDFQNTEALGPLLNLLLPILTGFGPTTSNPDVFTRTGK